MVVHSIVLFCKPTALRANKTVCSTVSMLSLSISFYLIGKKGEDIFSAPHFSSIYLLSSQVKSWQKRNTQINKFARLSKIRETFITKKKLTNLFNPYCIER